MGFDMNTEKNNKAFNKKIIVASLALAGTLLIIVSLVLTIISASQKSIIGGADFPTLIYIFMYENGGIRFYTAFLGVSSILSSLFVAVLKK
jgi:hypothetical protein